MSKTEIVELTEEDCINILGWWTAASMMVEGKLRTMFRDEERDTIAKITKAHRILEVNK